MKMAVGFLVTAFIVFASLSLMIIEIFLNRGIL